MLAVIAGTSLGFFVVFFWWGGLLSPAIDVAFMTKTLESQDYIFRYEYLGRRRTSVTVHEVPSYLIDKNIATYMLQFGVIIIVSHDSMYGRMEVRYHNR